MNLGNILTQMIDTAKADVNKAALPMLANFFQSIAANPTALNITAQLAKLQVDLLATLPGIQQDVMAQMAALLNQEAQALLSQAPKA